MFGISRLMRSISAVTPSATCTVFVPDCFCTDSRTPGRPLMRSSDRTSSVVSFDLGDVANIDGHAVARHQHEVADFVEALELRLAAQQVRALALVDFAKRRVLVFRAQQRGDALDRAGRAPRSFPSTARRGSGGAGRRWSSRPRRRSRARAAGRAGSRPSRAASRGRSCPRCRGS